MTDLLAVVAVCTRLLNRINKETESLLDKIWFL